ncbi:DUF1707 SHOCT-like domain-containing protein [Leifsonia shinshuensis]|uniref:DUF1707 domain-containing protein n=1 Tax=Leifsonia shinshuensis TaxID=150026 RepID=A0A7G6Y782_9MICO|nr:DUF1707 domain-containing protein [Leifsonia shinshuensis]QNE34347.1 DUF1707 domain-containing protein [Leifsonia shinshuensis]
MTDFGDPSSASLRLSNDERERAVAALQSHAAQGRLSDAELQSRVAAARSAVTRGDLQPLFADLPGVLHLDGAAPAQGAAPAAAGGPADPAAAAWQASQPGPAPYGYPPAPGEHGRPVNRWGLLVVSIMPFVAVILFFLTGMAWGYAYSWLWFLLIPLAGALVYGVDGGDRRRR